MLSDRDLERLFSALDELTVATRRIANAKEMQIRMCMTEDSVHALRHCDNCGCNIVRQSDTKCPACGDYNVRH